MKLNKKLVVMATLVMIMGGIFTTSVLAQDTDSSSSSNGVTAFFHKVWRKLGFEKDQNVSMENPENMPVPSGSPLPIPSGSPVAGMGNMNSLALDELVKEGKITKDQETAILAEVESLMKQMQTDLKTWATAQGIDSKYVLMALNGGTGGVQKGMGTQGGKQPNGPKPSGSPMPIPSATD
jgi:hypothetical protein